ncbi:PilZ domain-containing protein [Haliangium sp.]|uniref:PilZ domain-containing protein n=1 Tax=Haliangium sp. TaxID=2663208 RepID=UPI003D0B805F
MLAVIVSQNSALLRHLSATPFRRVDIDLHIAATGEEAVAISQQVSPAVAILDAEMPVLSGYEAARRIKSDCPDCRVVLILGKRISGEQLRQVSETGCDEVLIAPMSADELYDVVALQLGLPRRGSEAFTVTPAVIMNDGDRAIDGQVTNLSVDGVRMVVPEPLSEGTRLRLTIRQEGDARPIEITGQVVWAQEGDGETTIGASFEDLDPETRSRLARLTQWDLLQEADRIRVVIKGDITEASSFDDLVPLLVGRVDFDLSQVSYINSLGVREWISFLRKANIQGYEMHACSVPFILQAAVIPSMVGRGTVVSFFAPYYCESCDHHADRLLQSAAVLAAGYQPPMLPCPECGESMELDDIPERYLGFLQPDELAD